MRLSELGAIGSADLAGGHNAKFISVEGEHTPGINSDVFYLNQDVSDNNSDKERILAMVNDGVTGRREYVGHGLGQYAAKFNADTIPALFESMDVKNSPFTFSNTDRFPRFLKGTNYLEVFLWLTTQIKSPEFPGPLVAWVMEKHMDLFLQHKPTLKLDRLYGLTSAQIASSLLIRNDRFQVLLKLLCCIYQSVQVGKGAFAYKFGKATKRPNHLYATTTCSGVVETPEEYLLFGIGDSPVFAVDEMGVIPNSLNTYHSSGGNILYSSLGWGFDDVQKNVVTSMYLPSSVEYEGSVFKRRSGVSVRFVPKNQFFSGEYALVIMSDGIKFRSLTDIGYNIVEQILDTSQAIKEVVELALYRDDTLKKVSSSYSPDDKTMVIVQKK